MRAVTRTEIRRLTFPVWLACLIMAACIWPAHGGEPSDGEPKSVFLAPGKQSELIQIADANIQRMLQSGQGLLKIGTEYLDNKYYKYIQNENGLSGLVITPPKLEGVEPFSRLDLAVTDSQKRNARVIAPARYNERNTFMIAWLIVALVGGVLWSYLFTYYFPCGSWLKREFSAFLADFDNNYDKDDWRIDPSKIPDAEQFRSKCLRSFMIYGFICFLLVGVAFVALELFHILGNFAGLFMAPQGWAGIAIGFLSVIQAIRYMRRR